MPSSDKIAVPENGTAQFAIFISKVIRDEIEDFHVKYLHDEAMSELNPIIRNAVFSAVHVYLLQDQNEAARKFVAHKLRTVPRYWEAPVLDEDMLWFLAQPDN